MNTRHWFQLKYGEFNRYAKKSVVYFYHVHIIDKYNRVMKKTRFYFVKFTRIAHEVYALSWLFPLLARVNSIQTWKNAISKYFSPIIAIVFSVYYRTKRKISCSHKHSVVIFTNTSLGGRSSRQEKNDSHVTMSIRNKVYSHQTMLAKPRNSNHIIKSTS